jgi:hypothetical protein
MHRLKYIPWRSLLQVSGLTIAIALAVEILITLISAQSAAIRRSLLALYSPPLGILVSLAIAFGVGVLAVYLLERFFYRQVVLNTGSLWALVPCIALFLLVKSLLPLPIALISLGYEQIVGIVVGIFWKGRSYWR